MAWRAPSVPSRLLGAVLAVTLGACATANMDSGDGGTGGPLVPDAREPADARPPGPDAAVADAADPADARPGPDAGGADAAPAPDAAPSPDAVPADGGGTIVYAHTITIDGLDDFDATDETLPTSSTGYDAYAAWDAQYLYLGMNGADVSSSSDKRFWVIYLGGAAGTTTGVTYNTQQPALPFAAQYHVRWKADNTYTNALEWNGSAWVDAGWVFTGDIYQTGTFVELRIPLADIGSPSTLNVVVSMVNETAGVEGTFAAAPSGAIAADGYDPDFSRYFSFDLTSADPPASQATLP